MAAGRRSMKKELDELRAARRAAGRTWRQIAAEVRERYHVNPRVAFRLAHGWTQDEVARRYNERWPDEVPKTLKQVSYWENWEPGAAPSASARTPSYRTLDRLAQLYECAAADLIGGPDHGARDAGAQRARLAGVSGDAAAQDGGTHPASAPWEEADPTNRRSLLGLGLAATVTPETLRAVLRDAAAEAMEFTRATAASGVGTGTLAHLEAAITELDRSYASRPAAELFPVARAYRAQVARLIHGPCTLKEGRELYVHAAWLDDALAWLAYDLGDPRAAQAYAIDCFEHADQAGHDELCAWAGDTLNAIATYTGRPGMAVSAAMKGIARVPARHPLAVRLRAKAARAYAWIGDRDECERLFREAEALYERLPGRPPARLAHDTATLASYAMTANRASSFNRLGLFEQARTAAIAALSVHESDTGPSHAPRRETIARIDLGTALAGLGELDGALEEGHRVVASPHVTDQWVRPHAVRLAQVIGTRHPGSPKARELVERLRATTGDQR